MLDLKFYEEYVGKKWFCGWKIWILGKFICYLVLVDIMQLWGNLLICFFENFLQFILCSFFYILQNLECNVLIFFLFESNGFFKLMLFFIFLLNFESYSFFESIGLCEKSGF